MLGCTSRHESTGPESDPGFLLELRENHPELSESELRAELLDEWPDGRKEAEADIRNGKLKFKAHGLPAKWAPFYFALLRKECGIETEYAAGCVTTRAQLRYLRDYWRWYLRRGPARRAAVIEKGATAGDILVEFWAFAQVCQESRKDVEVGTV